LGTAKSADVGLRPQGAPTREAKRAGNYEPIRFVIVRSAAIHRRKSAVMDCGTSFAMTELDLYRFIKKASSDYWIDSFSY
jgi:hypothetical protein